MRTTRYVCQRLLIGLTTTAVLAVPSAPVFAAEQSLLHSETPKADKLPIASSQGIAAPRSFKLNVGISQEYVLGPGDVLSVTDLCSEDERGTVSMAPVLPDGTAVISYSGVVNAAGMSLREINDLVNERAKKYFVHPQLMINLAKQRPTQIYMLGDVLKPGLYCPDGGAGGAKDEVDISTGGGGGDTSSSSTEGGASAKLPTTGTIFTLSSALQLAGGLKETADIRHIHVTRQHPKQVIDVDLWKLMLDGDVTEDLVLQPGDVVFVPKGGTEFNTQDFGKVVAGASKVRIIGAVKSPGLYVMSADDDVMSVLAKAGGFLPTAKTGYLNISRVNRDGTTSTEKVKVKDAIKGAVAAGRLRLHPGEVIVVDNSMAKQITYGAARILPQTMMSGVMSLLLFRLNNSGTNVTVSSK